MYSIWMARMTRRLELDLLCNTAVVNMILRNASNDSPDMPELKAPDASHGIHVSNMTVNSMPIVPPLFGVHLNIN